MKTIETIKQELQTFKKKYRAQDVGLEATEGNNLVELFTNILTDIGWYKGSNEKIKEFNSIFGNELVIEDGILLCDCTGLTSVTIPNSVTSIREFAFACCDGLTSITIPNSITSIDESAFAYCRELKSITIPDSVTTIGESAFEGCIELTSVTIPNSVISINDSAFWDCNPELEIIKK